jgi:glycosyltransferase involved in cell wall biosynthesis
LSERQLGSGVKGVFRTFPIAYKKKESGKTRVVIVTDSMPPWNFGGKEERLRLFNNSIPSDSKNDIEVVYATMKWWDDKPPLNHIAISKLRPMYVNGRRSIKQALLFALSCFAVLGLKPDVIEVDQIPILPIYVLKLVAMMSRASLSITWHEVWEEEDWDKYLGHLGKLASKTEKTALKLSDQIVAVSIPTRFKLIRAGVPEHKIVLIEAEIDRNEISQASTKLPATDLLYAGRLIDTKNVELIIEAVAILAKENVVATASIVGDGPELNNLLKLTKELGVQSQITFHGFLKKNVDVWGLMKKCAIFISPSIREGFGFAVMEAHFAGAQVLIAQHSNNSANYYLNDLEGVVAVKDASARTYAEAIKSLLSNLKKSENTNNVETADIYQKYAKSWKQLRAAKRLA